MAETGTRVALLAGASGLVGGYLLDALLESGDFSRVFAVTRRPLGREHSRLANRIVLFDKLESQLKGQTCDVAFCCIGAPLGKSGSERALRQVDFDYVLAIARAARAGQAQRFVVVTCAGADPGSRDLRLRVKGEVERELEALGFPSLDIIQPGRLLGWRKQVDVHQLAATLLMPLINPLLVGARLPHRGIPARTVAAAMLGAARSGRRGVYRYTYGALNALAVSKPALSPRAQSVAR
ncbi:MAG: NAD(P)H-binding protein [Steroidobacteraceae bacterium]|nr:NAD(P)H-binding protein [Steroidobacteraceae bacterium]